MSDTSVRVSETLYEARAHFTQITEYGVSMEAFLAGEATPPPEGIRIDVAFEGTLTGQRLKGSVRGVDYLQVRADGHVELHIHASIATPDGANIAFFADGVGTAAEEGGLVQIRESVILTTACAEYAWVNRLPIWASGTVDPAKGEINVTGYVA
jgi:hypothetical protein